MLPLFLDQPLSHLFYLTLVSGLTSNAARQSRSPRGSCTFAQVVVTGGISQTAINSFFFLRSLFYSSRLGSCDCQGSTSTATIPCLFESQTRSLRLAGVFLPYATVFLNFTVIWSSEQLEQHFAFFFSSSRAYPFPLTLSSLYTLLSHLSSRRLLFSLCWCTRVNYNIHCCLCYYDHHASQNQKRRQECSSRRRCGTTRHLCAPVSASPLVD